MPCRFSPHDKSVFLTAFLTLPQSVAMPAVMSGRRLVFVFAVVLATAAQAQIPTPPGFPPLSPQGAPAPAAKMFAPTPPAAPAVPGAAPAPPATPTVEAGQSSIYLSAVLATGDTQPVTGGLKWRVYREQAEADGSHQVVAESSDASPVLVLPDGSYIVHAAFGLAGATRRVELRGQSASERVVLNAGALRVIAMLGDAAVQPQRGAISIYVPERNNPEAKLIAANVRPGDTICLPEGTYHIESMLADTGSGAAAGIITPTNSVVNADLRIQAGKLLEATLRHKAALMTLKLVNNAGGEALANTTFTVLTPGGDVIRELIGAFPSLVLAEGEYVAIARHDGKTYQSVFQVHSTLDRDVEVVAK
jgi:hypothetical protein